MQLDYRRVQTRNPNGRASVSFEVLRDGVVVADVGTRSAALARMDALWNKRPEGDRVIEQLYTGDD